MTQEYFYDFRLHDTPCGYSYLRVSADQLLSVTRFRISDDEIYTNRFALKLDDDRVIALKYGDQDWVDFVFPKGHYPSCAYPLLLPKVTTEPFDYIQVAESELSIVGPTSLLREGDDIVEMQSGKVMRRFTMKAGIPVRIDWGGAISVLHESAAASAQASGLTFTLAP